jgi:hypothetical protein
MEVPRETIQTQRQNIPSSEGLGATDGNAGADGGGVQRYGVSLDPEGNIIEFNGQEVGQEGIQKESVKKESRQKVISFY